MRDRINDDIADTGDFFPVFIGDFADENCLQAGAPAKLHVSQTVANHYGTGKIDVGEVALCLPCHADFRLAAVATATRDVGANVNGVKFHAVGKQQRFQMSVNLVNIGFCAKTFGNALLIRYNNKSFEIID